MVAGGLGPSDGFGGYRRKLVEALRERGISDIAVLAAVAATPRHIFMPASVQHRAYEDSAVPIGSGQTISQPFIQARYLQLLALAGTEKVLEIGTGSGYQTALLAQLCRHVTSIERLPVLGESARAALAAAGYTRNVQLLVGDGTLGWAPNAPYDGILVTAGGPQVPAPLTEQLAIGGRLLIPLGTGAAQVLTLVVRTAEGWEQTPLEDARFVPLIGEHGHSQH